MNTRRWSTRPARTHGRAAQLASGALAVLAAAFAVSASAAPDTTPPRIVAAAMQDRDGDARADHVRLTYSERVRHAADRDGRYPVRVAGYRIRSVGAASGRTIVLRLMERIVADGTARPAVRYTRTTAGAVTDRARNQARPQLFRATKPHGRKATPPPPPVVADRDGDGTANAEDCAPDDPKIHPGATDLPDLAFADANCDGIDGTESKAIFVSPSGNDGNPGTKAAPKRQLSAAVAAAAGTGKTVLAAAGAYGKVAAATGVGVYGGYDPKTWKRGLELQTLITGAPEAVLAVQDTNVVLQLLTVRGVTTGVPGTSAYAIRAVGSALTLQRVTVRAGNGSRGTGGARGADGVPGGPGEPGGRGQCDGRTPGAGGAGGASPSGRTGGRGGLGGRITPGQAGEPGRVATPGGHSGKGGSPGADGGDGTSGAGGTHGAHGAHGDSGMLQDVVWVGKRGTDGVQGAAGHGGGGGGGGGPQICLLCDDGSGNGGGGGGGGGAGGRGGTGGTFGGGSFGLFLNDSTATITDRSSIVPGAGGVGGDGGDGGVGGPGGDPGPGGVHCKAEVGEGGDGGRGGPGGRGGGGGGGAGGPGVGIFLAAGSKASVSADSTVRAGEPGPGGAGGAGGSGRAAGGATGRSAPISKP